MPLAQPPRKPVIGIVTSVIDHRKARGTALVALRFLERLHAYSDTYSFYFIHHDQYAHPLYAAFPEIRIPKLPWPFNRQLYNEAWFWLVTARHLPVHFDLVHYLHPRVWPSYIFTRAKRILLAGYEGAHMLPENRHGNENLIFRITSRFLHYRMHAITACSESGRKEIIETYNVSPDQVFRIYLGVDEIYHTPDTSSKALTHIRAAYGISTPYILAVSRFDAHKNTLGILAAYAQFAKEVPHTSLVLVGGPHSAAYSKKCMQLIEQLRADGRTITILPFVEEVDMPTLYANASLLLYPSLHEGFGLPVLEAMAAGTPVITSCTSSLPEVAGDAALLVDPYDTHAIGGAMIRLTRDTTLRDELIRAGKARVARFSWDQMTEETLSLYKKLLGSYRRDSTEVFEQ